MATPPYKWYSLSEMIAERDWKEMRPYDQPEKKIDHDKIRNIHGSKIVSLISQQIVFLMYDRPHEFNVSFETNRIR